MLKESAVERLRFTCPGCRSGWTADYDVQHIEEPDGDIFEYYCLNGVPVEVPTCPGVVTCPRCGRPTTVKLLARREIPLAAASPTAPRSRVDPARAEAARAAPLLEGSGQVEGPGPPARSP